MHFVEVQLHCMPRPMPSIPPSIPQLPLSLPPYEAELMLRVSFMHMLFYLSSVPLSHPHGQHLPLTSTRSLRVQLGGVAQVTLGCCWVGRYRRDNERLCGVEPLCRCVVRSLPFSSANKKSPAAREVCCCAVVAACCTARRRAGLPAR